ncbi:MAG TPA: hypothetical protein PLG17_12410, partial [Thermodesulfobacteriota bacterium]|nr:hypothetical protein [Thermodesulfobacteriota bacterium]
MNVRRVGVLTLICFSFLLFGATKSWAILEYMDGKLTLNGFLRTQVGIHIAESNPNLAYMGEDNHHLSMWRNWVQLEPN